MVKQVMKEPYGNFYNNIDEIKEEQKEVEDEIEDLKRKERLHLAAPKGLAKPKAVPKKKKAIPLAHDAWTAEQLVPYIPVTKGCSITVEGDWHHRFRGWYPKDAPPKSHSANFEDGPTMREAARSVLRWLWAEHLAATGQQCPWDIADDLPLS